MSALQFETLDEMISPAGLSRLLGYAVDSVHRHPLDVQHLSGNTLEQLRVRHASQVSRFVLKHFNPEDDWIMRLTHDHAVREVALFRGGIYARLPPQCYVPTIAAARNGSSWSSLMLDVSGGLERPGDTPISPADLQRIVGHLAAVHAWFLADASLRDPVLGLCSLRDFVSILAPATVQQEIARGRTHPVLLAAARGWAVFDEVAPREAVQIVASVQLDVRPLLAILAGTSYTLLHGDYKLANLGKLEPPATPEQPEARTIMLDWQDATLGPPLLDLGYFLAVTAARLPIPKEQVLALYRDALVAGGYAATPDTWERDVALGLFAGGALRLLWHHALGTQAADRVVRSRARAELAWWCEQVVHAGRWLPRH